MMLDVASAAAYPTEKAAQAGRGALAHAGRSSLRQLRDVRRDPPRLVAGEQVRCRAPSRLVLEDSQAWRYTH